MTMPLAAELGRLAAPAQGTPFDDVRLALLDALIIAKSSGDLGQDTWEDVFGSAMRSLRLRVLAEAETAIRAAAAHSRYPAHRLLAILPDATAADTLLHRLLAEGMALEQFEGFADDPVTRRARAAALEAAWDGAVRLATAERSRWRAAAMQVAAWRRPMVRLWILSIGILLLAALLAGWLSGELPAPGWFRPINDWWWRLWP
jgi:hypothetical protein